MKIVIRISTRIRSAAPIPRDFLPISGLEHLGLIYQQRIIESPEEFNATLATVNDRRFASRGCEFFPYALTADDEAKLAGAPAPVVATESTPVEAVTESDVQAAVYAEVASGLAGVKAMGIDAEFPSEIQINIPVATPPDFRLEGKGIFLGDERVAGLFGDEKQLRVLADHQHLRPQIEAWLNSQTDPLL